jgi:hypothetical protein
VLVFIAERLRAVVDKPDGVSLHVDAPVPAVAASEVWSNARLGDLLADTSNPATDAHTIVLHTVFVTGQPPEADMLGWAPHPGMIVLFSDLLCGVARERVDCDFAQQFVWLHEAGHHLGLVRFGAPMLAPHEDRASTNHCDEAGCVMRMGYVPYQGPPELWEYLRPPPPAFGEQCRADLAAVRARR